MDEILNLGSRVVNAWLFRCEDGYVLIDTGYENGFAAFRKKLRRRGIDPKRIRYVFLTHAHDDHAGFLNEVLALTDAKVILHPKAVEGLRRGQNSFAGGCSSRTARAFCGVLALAGKGEHRFPPIRPEFEDRLIPIDSEEFCRLSLPFEAVPTPGHSADHIALRRDDVLFCGDAAMNGFPSRRRTIIWIEDPEQYRRSWETILALGYTTLYPAHGKPFPAEDLRRFLPSLDRIRLFPLPRRGGN